MRAQIIDYKGLEMVHIYGDTARIVLDVKRWTIKDDSAKNGGIHIGLKEGSTHE